MVGQLFNRHPVNAGTPRILSNTLQRESKVLTLARHLHQFATSQVPVSTISRRRFHTQNLPLRLHHIGRSYARTFIRLLWHNSPEMYGRFTLPIFRPFAACTTTTASADFSPHR